VTQLEEFSFSWKGINEQADVVTRPPTSFLTSSRLVPFPHLAQASAPVDYFPDIEIDA
jgi:hypothetical protein